MRVDITGRHVEITPPLKQLIDRRLAPLRRVLNESAISAQLILTKEKYRHKTELAVFVRGDQVLQANGEGNSWQISLRQAAAKVEQQAKKLKGKWDGRKRKNAGTRTIRAAAPAPAVPPADGGARIVRATRYPVKPMSIEDAALRVDAGPDTFVVFRNADTDAVSILYRRKDGNLGLIEPD